MTQTVEGWHQANQRHLAQHLARVRGALELHVARMRGGPVPLESAMPAPGGAEPTAAPMALDQLCATFRLSPFERDILLLCAGVDMDSAFAPLCAAAQGDPQRAHVTFSLALAALPDAHWSALAPASPLRRWRMIDVGAGVALTSGPLRIDERVLHYLAGVDSPDERLAGLLEPVRWTKDLAPSHRSIAERIAAVWTRAPRWSAPPVIQLCGDGPIDKRAIAASACNAVGLTLWSASADVLPASASETEMLIRLWEREAALSGSVLLIDCSAFDGTDGTRVAALARFVERTHGALVVAGQERRRLGHRASIAFEVNKPSADEQRTAWREALGEAAERLNGDVELLVSQFNLGTQSILTAIGDAHGKAAEDAETDFARAIWEACRAQARPRLDDLAQRIEPAAGWDDVVLPEAQRQILRDVAAHVRQRATVYDRWGFAGKGSRGLGISALFAGASGTGKTMAAEVLANELNLDLYRIDLSSVVSKYIGETEKNLRRIFDAAEEGGAILLFDEADALFGKRSEVKDSHDRYANIEVSYLLQRMECYRGLAILTTNLKGSLDTAFLRRIRFIVQFPFPDHAQREEIWRRVFPKATPTDGLDAGNLARLNVAGGNIRNIAMNAAFLAADAGEPVRMTHLLRAARGEYAKLEKPLTDAEIAGWV